MRFARFRPNTGCTSRLLCAGIGAALVEAFQTGRATKVARATSSIVPAGWEAFATVLIPALLAALIVGRVFDSKAPRRVAHALSSAFPQKASAAFPLALIGFVCALGAAVQVGRRISTKVTPNVTISVTLVAFIAAMVAFVPLVPTLSDWLTPALAKVDSWLAKKPLAWRAIHGVLLPIGYAAIAIVGLVPLFPSTFLPSLIGAVGGFAIATMPWARLALVRGLRGRRGLVAVALLFVISIPAPFLLGRLPPTGRMIVLYRSPIAASILTGVRGMVDRDHDGYSPILLGGDCNDHDANINPGEPDIPNNGIDENCSGADATPYTPYKQKAYQAPVLPTAKANVVMIVMDALRPDHLGFAGYGRPTSPNLDAFRAQSTWFRRTYTAASTTRFSLATIMTGLDVEKIPQHRKRVDLELLPGTRVMGEHIRDVGYDTVGYTDSYVLQHIKGVGGGFRIWEGAWPPDDWRDHFTDSATMMTDAALKYLNGHPPDANKPFLLMLHYRCTHDPYGKNPRWSWGSQPIDDYDSGLAYCDDEIGRLLKTMDARSDANRTVTTFFSDHGELFGEHGFTQHGSSVFEPDVRATLVIRVPFWKTVPVVDTSVSLMDLYPTMLAFAGAPRDPTTDAWNLFPLLMEGSAAGDPKRPLFLYTDLTKGTVHHQARGVVVDRLKYVRDISTGTTGLFDVIADPGEANDLSAGEPVDRARMAELLESWERGTSGK